MLSQSYVNMPVSPFKFLDSYTRDDREIFFGRDREIEEMYQKVFESKMLLVYGISGTGKTSLINCGLANKFEDSDWLPVTVRRGRNILESLVGELHKVSVTTLSPPSPAVAGTPPRGRHSDSPPSLGIDTPTHIVKSLQSIYLDHFKPIYLIYDQFEELFIFGDREEREQFIRVVKAIVESDVQCKFIFSIREEYLASATEFELTITDFLANRMRVEKITRQHAVEVIEGPCKVHGIEVEEGFSEALLNKLNPESNEVELTYLQVFLDKIYRLATKNNIPRSGINNDPQSGSNNSPEGTNNSGVYAPSSNSFTILLLEKIGDVSDLLGSFLEEQISALDDPDTGLAILKSFVSIKGTKKQITEEEVLESSRTYGKDIEKERLKELIRNFVNLRILRDKDESGRYELRHDSLAAKIYEKITLVEKEILEVRQLIENAYNSYLQRKILLSQEDLKFVAHYEDRLFLTKELHEFVSKSKADYLAKRKAFQRVIGISTFGFILIVVAIGYYYFQKSRGARTKEWIIAASLQLESSPELSLQTAFRAYEADSTGSLAKKAILDAFYALDDRFPEAKKRLFNFSPCSVNIASARFSNDGNFIYGWLENNEVKVWDDMGHEVYTTTPDTIPVLHVLLSGDNQYIGVLLKNDKVKIHSLKEGYLFDLNTTTNRINDRYLFDFSCRDNYLLVVVNGNAVNLYDRAGFLFQELDNHLGRVNALDISPDERFIATASSDNTVNIWYYNRNLNQFSVYDSITWHQDAVRSCLFNHSSDFILTASDDSITAIWYLNGAGFRLDGQKGTTIRPQLPWEYEHAFNQYILGKKCNAVFSTDQKSITITVYHVKDSAPPEYRYYVVHAQNSIFSNIGESYYMYPYLYANVFQPVMDYQSLVPSANDSNIAAVVKGGETTNLVAPDALLVRKFEGIQPDFSPDGRYLLCIQNNTLHKYIIDVEEIRRLVYKEKIFGELEINYQDWITY